MTPNGESPSIERLADLVLALGPKPRLVRWASLSLCVVDAVWSINLDYEKYVLPAVYAVARDVGIERPLVPITEPTDDPAPLSAFLERYPAADLLVESTSRHRTSTRSGILKADAALRYAEVIRSSADTLDEAQRLISDSERLEAVNSQLRKIPGEGQDEIRRGYLWMVIGDENSIKPDRMVLRWFQYHGVADVNPGKARRLVVDIVTLLNARPDRPRNNYTAWEVDKALWEAGKELPAQASRQPRRRDPEVTGCRFCGRLTQELRVDFEQAAAERGLTTDAALAQSLSRWLDIPSEGSGNDA